MPDPGDVGLYMNLMIVLLTAVSLMEMLPHPSNDFIPVLAWLLVAFLMSVATGIAALRLPEPKRKEVPVKAKV